LKSRKYSALFVEKDAFSTCPWTVDGGRRSVKVIEKVRILEDEV
jgi:hypothetical protein